MPEYDINSKDPVEMFRAIREQIYEETKHMTIEELMEYTRQGAEEYRQLKKEVNPDNCDLSWLRQPAVK